MNKNQALIVIWLCLLAGAGLRLINLDNVPPGLHYDEAANGLLSAEIGLNGERPVFIPSYTGKEPFYFYLAGGLIRMIGESIFVLRLTSAFLGILTIAATYRLGIVLLRDRRVALLSTTLLAISFWHILFSRIGFRAISQPLMQTITITALFIGFRHHSWRWIVVAGAALGATGYTYLASRVFPVPVTMAALLLLIDGKRRGLRLKQLSVFFGAGLVTLIPLLLYFLQGGPRQYPSEFRNPIYLQDFDCLH